MESSLTKTRSPFSWVPSLYFAEAIPYVMVMTVSVILYKKLGISNTQIALYTSWLYLPWVIKPLWSPLVDLFLKKRHWIVSTQFLMGIGFSLIAFTLPMASFFQASLAVFWVLAFFSATHDIAADGFYMLGLSEKQQAAFVGIRSTFYRIAIISGQGLLVILAGQLENRGMTVASAWSITFFVVSAIFLALFLYHAFFLPSPVSDAPAPKSRGNAIADFFTVFALFFRKKGILAILGFLIFFRFAESQLLKLAAPFLLDVPEKGGLGLSTSQIGFVYGTVGILCLIAGGILGGYAISRKGLKYWIWIMALALNLPDFVYVYFAHAMPQNFWIINTGVAIEQFGYGFGFTAYSLFMIMTAQGEHKTAHFAICTGFMALGMMIPGMFSGYLQDILGYKTFFWWVMLSTIPSFLVLLFVKIEANFGTRER